ncbi:MAG TPA: hypothetical protein VGW12_03155 [Pyrinomonadaceae bacterium]|nr:hypothetical protein [Pyrinomonadaceae bacterium]
MSQNGVLKLELVDTYGKRLKENVDVALRNEHLAADKVFRKNQDASKIIPIKNLFTGAHGVYRLDIDPPSYHPLNLPVRLNSSTTEKKIVFPVDLTKVVSVNFLKFSALATELKTLLNNSSASFGLGKDAGQALYEDVLKDEIRKAGLSNIACKSLATVLPGGKNVLTLLTSLEQIEGDRVYARTTRELFDEVKLSEHKGLFDDALGGQHHPPPKFSDYILTKSFKTANDRYGNLQCTFFQKGEDYLVDIDIDDAAGLGHVFQVLRNHFTGKPTHPYNIHEILLKEQQLDPRYTFNLK